jgi:hypothetical protein
MASLNNVKAVVKKISTIENLGDHLCFFGGSVPYIYYNKESNREHSDVDILVDKEYMDVVRQLAKQGNLYRPNLDLRDDYGLKLFIDGVYVEFEPMYVEDGMLIRKSFSPDKSLAGVEMIPFEELTDLIVELNIDGVKSYCQSPELIKAEKEQYKREKDLLDINFIDSQGIDVDKYHRVKKSIESSTSTINTYEELKNKKTL